MLVLAGGLVAGTLDVAYACLLLYVVMNYIIVPLSAAGPGSKDPLWIALSIAVHALLIGVPIALFTRRAQQQASPEAGKLSSPPARTSL